MVSGHRHRVADSDAAQSCIDKSEASIAAIGLHTRSEGRQFVEHQRWLAVLAIGVESSNWFSGVCSVTNLESDTVQQAIGS